MAGGIMGRGERTLLVASTGGHLEQLARLRQRFTPEVASEVVWVTFDTDQARTLLAGETVHFVRYVSPRDLRGSAAILPDVRRILHDGGFSRLVSTGAAIAVPFFAVARAMGIRCHYVESSARATGPSLSGRLVSLLPGVRLYTQYPSWASHRWLYRGSVLDSFEAAPPDAAPPAISRVVVTLGTMRKYGFRRALETLVGVLPEVVTPDAEILWQVGYTDCSGLAITARQIVPAAELNAAVRQADLVISHAGVGSAVMTLEAGRCPVMLPRRAAYGEHVDDHQTMIASELSRRGLAIASEADGVTPAALEAAAIGHVVRASLPPAVQLVA
jgi:UDP-N-acetylglucosamine transferase subunit ALG13